MGKNGEAEVRGSSEERRKGEKKKGNKEKQLKLGPFEGEYGNLTVETS